MLYWLSKTLFGMNLWIQNLREQTYGSASNMLGYKSGVGTNLSQILPKAFATHCQGHSLNLWIENTMKNSMVMRDVLGTVP